MIIIPESVFKQIEDSLRKAYPEEGCGLLIGPVPKDFQRPGREVRAESARTLGNGWESSAKTNRYAIDPKQLMLIEKELAGTGRGIVGFYHSHPDVPAWPSPFDLLMAWPCYSYLIVSVRGAGCAGARAWTRSEDGNSFIEEELVIVKGEHHERSSQASHGPSSLR